MRHRIDRRGHDPRRRRRLHHRIDRRGHERVDLRLEGGPLCLELPPLRLGDTRALRSLGSRRRTTTDDGQCDRCADERGGNRALHDTIPTTEETFMREPLAPATRILICSMIERAAECWAETDESCAALDDGVDR